MSDPIQPPADTRVRVQRFRAGDFVRIDSPARNAHGWAGVVSSVHCDPFLPKPITGAMGTHARYFVELLPDAIGVPANIVEMWDWELRRP